MSNFEFDRSIIYTSMQVFFGLFCNESNQFELASERYSVFNDDGFVFVKNIIGRNSTYSSFNTGYEWKEEYNTYSQEKLLELVYNKLEYEKFLG